MKFTLNGTSVIAAAETVQESAALLKLAEKFESSQEDTEPAKPAKPAKTTKKTTAKKKKRTYKRQVRRECPVCKKVVKGDLGLAQHARKMHGMSLTEVKEYGKMKESIPERYTPIASVKIPVKST